MIFGLIKHYIKKNKRYIIFYICISLTLSILALVMPYLSGTFIDELIQKPSLAVIYKFTFLAIVVSLLQIIISYFSSVLSIKLKTKLTYEFNKDIILLLQNISLIYLDKKNIAYLNQRVNADCSNIIDFSMMFLNGAIINMIAFIVCFVVIVNINVKISILIFTLILAYGILYLVMHKPLSRHTYQLKEITATYISKLQEQLQDVRIIKTFDLFHFFSVRIDTCYREYLASNIKMTKLNFVFRSSDIMIKLVSQILLFLIGGYEILEGRLTIGLFTILSSYFMNLTNSVKFFLNVINQFISNSVSADRIRDIQKVKIEPNGNFKVEDIYCIDIKNLNFGYDDNLIFINFHCQFKKGHLYKICGENGKGKSTLIDLIIGLYSDKYTGNISYDSRDLRELDLHYLRRYKISYVGQTGLFFKGTILENLSFGENNLNIADIKDFLHTFLYDSYINIGIDDFLNMELNDSNSNFSGGELEKLAIIRGLLKISPVLILDEPTNSLDTMSKLALKEIIANLKTNRIIILVSHDDCFNSLVDYEISI